MNIVHGVPTVVIVVAVISHEHLLDVVQQAIVIVHNSSSLKKGHVRQLVLCPLVQGVHHIQLINVTALPHT